jgi:hypothetical protein
VPPFSWALSASGGARSTAPAGGKAILLASVVAFSLCSFLSGLAARLSRCSRRAVRAVAEGPFLPVCQSLVASESEHRGAATTWA